MAEAYDTDSNHPNRKSFGLTGLDEAFSLDHPSGLAGRAGTPRCIYGVHYDGATDTTRS